MPGLDGVRALAVSGVFLLHLDRRHFPGGAVGVDVFFVLSAFLITGLLLDEMGPGKIDFGAFYLRRVFRLVPALATWLAVIVLPTALYLHEGRRFPLAAIGGVFYFNDFLEAFTRSVPSAMDQSWSLAVEEQFYVVWPALLVSIMAVGRRRQAAAFLALCAGGLALMFRGGNYFLPTGHLFPLALGATAAWLASRRTLMAKAAASALLAAGSTCLLVAALFFHGPEGSMGGLWQAILDVAAVVLIVYLASVEGAWSRVFGSVPMRWIGARSYGIYLYGLTLMQLIGSVTGLPLHKAAPLDIALTLVVAGISYRFLESPVRARGRRWLAAHEAPVPALA